MSRQYCFLCASDEGVFLVVTPDNCNIFNNQLETCLTTKVDECIELSNNICYKCAYELDQCTKFVEKYKKSHEIAQPKVKSSTPYCYLCFEFVESDRIFDITKDNRAIFHPLQKIRNIFNEDLSKKDDYSRLVCLTCRYNLDVLYDLKRVHHETIINLKALINKEIDYASFPKVHTDVINRKTTVTTFPDITFYGLVNSDTESNEDMARNCKSRVKTQSNAKKLRNDVKVKGRICNHCHNIVANGIDMYRFHRTGLTVCKSCWLTIDPTKDRGKKQLRKIQDNSAETKMCSVFLTDVLSEESHKSEKVYRVEKDKEGNKFYIISDESSLEEDKSSENSRLSISPKLENYVNGDAQQGKKRRRISTIKSDIESTPIKVTRSNQKRTNVNERNLVKSFSDAEKQSTTNSTQQKHKRTRTINDSSDSDVPLKTVIKTRKLNNHGKFPSSSKENMNSPERKKLKSILKGITTNVRIELSDQSSNEDSMTPRRKTRNASNSSNTKEIKKESYTRTRLSSVSSMEISSEFKSPKVAALSETKIEYICDECNKEFDTKLLREEHRLTHFKQAVLKLERITVPSKQKKQETEVDSQEGKISKKIEACSSGTIFTNKNAEDLSEEIAINIDDDTDDEEIFNLRKSKHVQEEIKKVIDDKSSNETNELDMTEDKSCIEDKSAKIINEEVITKKSQQCEELAIVSDEAVTSVEMQDDQDAKRYTETSIDRGIDTRDTNIKLQEAIVTTVENQKNLDVEKNDARTENNIVESATEEEKCIDRCDNDEKDVYEDITVKTIADSSALSTSNKIKDNENDNKNEADEDTADVEIIQCNSANKSLKKDKLEGEREKDIISNVTDKTDILNDERNLENIKIIEKNKAEILEKQHNRTNEQNMKIEAIIDKTNIDNKDKPNFLNCEKFDEHNKEEDDVAVIFADSNHDAAKSKETIEEIATNNSNMENVLDDTKLMESNIMSNNYEEQELSNDANNSSTDAANEILKEVFEFAANEVHNQEDDNTVKYLENTELETMENVSREACNDADMPSLDPISVMEIDDNDITLN